eukprot:3818970-Karenia_brevis.AAC.1
MPAYKMTDVWRARFRRCEMMPTAEALVAPHAPNYHNAWHRKVTDSVPHWWIDSSGAPPVGNMPLYRGQLEE